MPTDLYCVVDGLLDEELALYRELDSLVYEEELAVSDSDMDALMNVLQKKQGVITNQESLLDKWQELSIDLGLSEGREGPAFWNAIERSIDEKGYKQLLSRIEEIRKLGQMLLEREKGVQKELEGRLADMRQKLLRMNQNRNAVLGYAQNSGG